MRDPGPGGPLRIRDPRPGGPGPAGRLPATVIPPVLWSRRLCRTEEIMTAHEAGGLHAPGYGSIATVPAWLRPPPDVNELLPQLWAGTVRRNGAGALEVGGVDARDIAAEHGTPAYVLDEADFRARAVAFRDAFQHAFADLCGGADVYYACKAFLCTEVARWLAQDGLRMDACSGGELAVLLRAGVPPQRIGLHGNNKSDAELDRAVQARIGRIVIDSVPEIDRLADTAARHGVRAPVLLRVTVGVEAHTHEYIATAHEDQKFGLSLSGGAAAQAVRRILARPELDLRGLHSHIGSQIFDTDGFEVAARRLLGLHAQVSREYGVTLPEMDLGGGFGVAYTSEHDPLAPKALADALAAIVRGECRALGLEVPGLGGAGPGDRGPEHLHAVPRRDDQGRRARSRHGPPVHRGGRRHERQYPHGPVRRRLLLHRRLAC